MFTLDELKKAIKNIDLPQISEILDENPEFLRRIDNSGSTLLHWLASDQDNEAVEDPEEIVEFLLENYEININQTTRGGVTALHEAVTCQQTELVKLLLRHGANIQANEDGFTPLHLAANRNDTEITRLLLNHGADAYAKNNDGDTPAHLAATENDNAFTFNLLVEKVSDQNALLLTENNHQETPFQIALARTEFSADTKKDLIKIILLENPTFQIPEAVSENQMMLSAWHAYKTEIRAMQAEQIAATTTLYDLVTTTDPDTLSKDIIEEISIANLTTTAENFPCYKDFLETNLNKLAFIKDLQNKKIAGSSYSFYDIYQEKDERKLAIIFSNLQIENGVRGYLDSTDLSHEVPSSYMDKINNTLEKHLAAGVQRNRSLNNILDYINNEPKKNGLLPNEIKKEILEYLSLEELNRISDAINQVGLSLSISGPSINSSFFKRNSSDPDFDAEEKKPQKKLCIGH